MVHSGADVLGFHIRARADRRHASTSWRDEAGRLRHSVPSQCDQPRSSGHHPLNFDNIAKQRLLSEQGKRVAIQVGEAFKKLGIPLAKIYTSKFNRAVETGRLISGDDVTPTADVTEGGLVVTPIENDRRAEALKKMAGTAPEAGKTS